MNRLIRNGGFNNRILSVTGSLLGCQILLSSSEDRKCNGQPSCMFSSVLASASLSLEPHKTSLEVEMIRRATKSIDSAAVFQQEQEQQKPLRDEVVKAEVNKVLYDFVIVGFGNAGQSALQTLQMKCPHATIAIVDPLRSSNRGKNYSNNQNNKNRDHYRNTVVKFDPSSKTLRFLTDRHNSIGYKHGILIATGARGSPPCLELFEKTSLSRVLELRPTELPKNSKRPMMAPERVRKTVVEAAQRGAKIGILGSGWEALDLLLLAEREGKSNKNRPTICYASPGFCWNILPSYLSAELRKKLNKREIDLQDRSFVRYVADIQQWNCQQIELHTAKTYDLLDTRRTVLDLLVVAPDSFGDKGTAALPSTDIPERMKESSDGRPWYKTWSQIAKKSNLEPSAVVCFEDDGRIAVNTELSVASRIYAAGSCARYPNGSTGHSTVAGEGSIDGSEAGRVAALNMSQHYRQGRDNYFMSKANVEEAHSFATNSFPIWRSDITSYPAGNGDRSSALSKIGVQALCVGKCDSERQSTRAFWWTNSSAQRKMNRFVEGLENGVNVKQDDDDDGAVAVDNDNDTDMGDIPPNKAFIRRRESILLSRRISSRLSRTRGIIHPIYGLGVVFYLDNYGRIQGVMTWGLPFADKVGGCIKPDLLKYIKNLISTNAGVSALDAEDNHQLMNLALGKASQKLISFAMKGQAYHVTRAWHGLDGPIKGFATPLYRYTEVSNSRNKTVNVLKRQDGNGLGVLGEGLYARDDFILEDVEDGSSDSQSEEDETPANIPATMYPITVVPSNLEEMYGQKAISLESVKELNRYIALQRSWEANENRARPGKEDPIWLRPGDERRNTSGKQKTNDAYRRIIFPHRMT
mmetsp:Transcript_26744/g.30398  ORF Transcript_26744/g.30398 Transcript_26744/m.30398 type:complete len:865 (+) Transcript_26744:141-2735(+)